MATKIHFISIAPEFQFGSVTVAFFEDHIETTQWATRTPDVEYPALFPSTIKKYVDAGAGLVFTTTKQVDVLREKDRVSVTELDDIKKEEEK